MKTRWIACALVGALSIGFFAGTVFSEDPKPSEDDVMKQMIELAKPGPHHKSLAGLIGTWDVVSKMWMAPGEPEVTKAESVNESILGGRFIHMSYKGEMQKTPFQGSGVVGFDNFEKCWQSVWLDTMGTSMLIMEGKPNETDKTIDLAYEWNGPMGRIPGRMRYTFTGADSYKLEGWMTQGGQEARYMELTYTRRAKPAEGDR